MTAHALGPCANAGSKSIDAWDTKQCNTCGAILKGGDDRTLEKMLADIAEVMKDETVIRIGCSANNSAALEIIPEGALKEHATKGDVDTITWVFVLEKRKR
jgi:hypothetical protein